MALSDILSTLFSVGSAAAGSQGGGSTGGILSSLGSIFGDQTPSGYSPGLSTTLNVLGSLANQFKATPNEGATEEDIKKANRYNLLAGVLGGLASGAGQYMDTQAKEQALGGLSDILSGKGTTTGQGISPSGTAEQPVTMQQRLAQWTKDNPSLAEFGVKLQLEQAAKDQELLKEQYKAAQKAGGTIPSYGSALNTMALLGIPAGQRDEAARSYIADETQRKQEAVKTALAGIGAGQTGPLSSMTGTGAALSPTTQIAPQRQVLEDALKKNQAEGTPIEGRFPPGTSMEDAVKALEGAGFKEAPQEQQKDVYAKPAYMQMAEESATKTQTQEERKATQEENERISRTAQRMTKPYTQILEDGAMARKNFEKVIGNLEQGKFYNTRQAVKQLENLIDKSVVHPVEQKEAMKSLVGYLSELKRVISSAGNPVDLPKEAKLVLYKTAKLAYQINENAGEMAQKAINLAAEDFVRKNNTRATPSTYLKQLMSGKVLRQQIEQEMEGSSQTMPIVGASPGPAPSVGGPKVYRPGMMISGR